jgi:hypothetical protein
MAALPEINLGSLAFATSGLDGSLSYPYTVPSTQAPDPNAICPQTAQQFNAGLIGCGLAMIDLTTFKPVGAGSALLQYKSEPGLPPGPTLALSASTATKGQTVTVSDAPGATTYWWLSTLSALEGLLGGVTASAPTVTVTLRSSTSTAVAANTISVSPALYNRPTLTPPKLEGGFTVPTGVRGKVSVTVSDGQTLLSFPLSISATGSLKVKK